jgi:hypothetical protein
MEYYIIVLRSTAYEILFISQNKADATASYDELKKHYLYPIGKKADGPELLMLRVPKELLSELEVRMLNNLVGKGQISNRMLKALLDRLFNSSTSELLAIENYDTIHKAALEKEHAARVKNLKTVEHNTCFDCGTEDYFAEQSGADDFISDLTEEEITYLRLKWGKTYKPEEWIRLE